MTSPRRPGGPLRSLTRVGAWLLAVLAAVSLLVLSAGTASAAPLPDGQTRVRACAPETITAVGVSEHVRAGQGRGPPVLQGQIVVATGVAAETGADAAGAAARACFVAGTQVLMADGTRKAIEDVKVGDKVTSRNVTTGKGETHTVTRTFVHRDVALYEVKVDGGKVTTTADHPFYVHGRGWTAVKDLRPGDQLDQADGTTVTVEAIVATGRTATVYNFEVEGVHDYYVQAGTHWVLVHNDCRGLWQITKEGTAATKNGPFGKLWKSKSDGLWWSRDTAGHGGSVWKVFDETPKGLQWRADADQYGDFIVGKHKGDTGMFIPWSDLG